VQQSEISSQLVSETDGPLSGDQVVRALFDAVCAGDVESVTKFLREDIVVTEPKALPFGGVYRGRDAFLAELLPAIVGPFQMGIEDVSVLGGGDRVAAVMAVTYTSRKTGRSLVMPYVEIYGFNDGLVSTIDVYPHDTAELAQFLRAEA
jgi:uncharacterized protein